MNAALRLHRLTTAFDRPLSDWGGSLLSLAIRLSVGWDFFKSGLTKIGDWDTTLYLFEEEYQVPLLPPELAAWMGAAGELVLPLLLFVGLFSRPAALGLFILNATALISYPALFEFECPAAVKDHFHWGALLLVITAFGPGRLSLDALIASRTR
ncbi:MAG: DoxX family protein [Rhodocyclaceae bacterium]|nr:DoxX family protein [Rhodocyclaceae bacterium]